MILLKINGIYSYFSSHVNPTRARESKPLGDPFEKCPHKHYRYILEIDDYGRWLDLDHPVHDRPDPLVFG